MSSNSDPTAFVKIILNLPLNHLGHLSVSNDTVNSFQGPVTLRCIAPTYADV